ncbi:substrate-binding domain-containing protein [Aquisphaera insulae]|uniref:substrate-binding domain-containing protein n=1 Tax=Aquisphaera insulae TaxID=2712864 RepID=UPI0013EBF85B|nr:substrate-binding domain-containing protein [Aquisphaera insulae]
MRAVCILAALLASCGGPRGSSGVAGRVHLIGFDAGEELIRGLAEHRLGGLVVQDPYRMGQLGVATLVAHLEKRAVEPRILTDATMVTPSNVADPKIRALVEPAKAPRAQGSLAGAKTRRWRIAMIPKGTEQDYWRTIHAGALEAERAAGDVEVVWQGPAGETDRFEQLQFVQEAVAAGVDGIVLAPLDARAMARPVEMVASKGIPVVIVDSGLESTSPISFISTDNHKGGVLAARRMGELLGGRGKVVLLRYKVGSESTEERERGFLETLAAEFPRISVLSDAEHAGPTAGEAWRKVEALLERFAGQIDGIFCVNESSTVGAMAALEAAGVLARER